MGVKRFWILFLSVYAQWLALYFLTLFVWPLGVCAFLLYTVDVALYFRSPYPERLAFKFKYLLIGEGFRAYWNLRRKS